MKEIKERLLTRLTLSSHPGLHVGECVPFYFCPRSVMLYVIHMANHAELSYRGGQGPIVHLEADLGRVVAWAEDQGQRWAFTLSNAASEYFEDRCDLAQLGEIDWSAVEARDWQHCSGPEQAEFLIEAQVPWELVARVGVRSPEVRGLANSAMQAATYKPPVEIEPDWYY